MFQEIHKDLTSEGTSHRQALAVALSMTIDAYAQDVLSAVNENAALCHEVSTLQQFLAEKVQDTMGKPGRESTERKPEKSSHRDLKKSATLREKVSARTSATCGKSQAASSMGAAAVQGGNYLMAGGASEENPSQHLPSVKQTLSGDADMQYGAKG